MPRESIIVKYAGVTTNVKIADVLYIESSNKKVIIHTRTADVACYGKLAIFEDNNSLFRCHRCYIVNMRHVVRFSANTIDLINGQTALMSRRRYAEFAKAYERYLAGQHCTMDNEE